MPYRKGQPKWVKFHGRKIPNQQPGESDADFRYRLTAAADVIEQELADKARKDEAAAQERVRAREERARARQAKLDAKWEAAERKRRAADQAKMKRDEERRARKARARARKAGYDRPRKKK